MKTKVFITQLSGNKHRKDGRQYLGFKLFKSLKQALNYIDTYNVYDSTEGRQNIIYYASDYELELRTQL